MNTYGYTSVVTSTLFIATKWVIGATEGELLSAFVAGVATERADEDVPALMATVAPANYFDRLLAALDESDAASHLT
jgi:hypothetical protein